MSLGLGWLDLGPRSEQSKYDTSVQNLFSVSGCKILLVERYLGVVSFSEQKLTVSVNTPLTSLDVK